MARIPESVEALAGPSCKGRHAADQTTFSIYHLEHATRSAVPTVTRERNRWPGLAPRPSTPHISVHPTFSDGIPSTARRPPYLFKTPAARYELVPYPIPGAQS